MVKCDDKRVIACCEDFLLSQCSLDLVSLDHFLLAQNYCQVSKLDNHIPRRCLPFMAYNLLLFFSRTKYTFPTSPLPINLILSKLPGPTSTFRTLMEFELYVLRKANVFRRFGGCKFPSPSCVGTPRLFEEIGIVAPFESTKASVLLPELWAKGCFPSSAVAGRSPPASVFENKPCAFGALATLLSFRANSSLPAIVA